MLATKRYYALSHRCGMRLQQLRKAQRLSRRALAKKVGFSNQYLGQIEQGEVRISLETLALIAQGLEVPLLACLDEGKDAASAGQRAEDFPLDFIQQILATCEEGGAALAVLHHRLQALADSTRLHAMGLL